MIISHKEFDIICKDEPYPEFDYLQKQAINEGWNRAIIDDKDTYFLTVMIGNIPAFSFTSVQIGDDVLRIVTKLYSNPEIRKNITHKLWKNIVHSCIAIFDTEHFNHIKLKLITRHPSLSNWKTIYRKLNWVIEEDNLYLIGRDKKKQTSWKQIYYKGDIDCLQTENISYDKYVSLFGPYTFTYDWSNPAIENAKMILKEPKNVLEIGTFEGRFAIWLAETYKCNVTTIDPFDGDVYGVSQTLFDEAYKNCINNLKKCKEEIKFIHKKSYEALHDLKDERFDFIYIDGSHKSQEVLEDLVMSYRLLNKDGIIMLDDSVYWKARKHITNELIHDVTESPRMAVDNFIHIHWKNIQVLKLANNYQTAFKKLS